MRVKKKIGSAIYRFRSHRFSHSQSGEKHRLNRPFPSTNWDQVERELRDLAPELGVNLADYEVAPERYSAWVEQCQIPVWYARHGVRSKKLLEHFISFDLLGLSKGQTYMDVASEDSPFPGIFRKQFGIRALSQDLTYPAGVHGDQVGSSAEKIPLPNEGVDKISLQCAFEHFQGEIDSNFVKEAVRLLRPGGRLVIVPLYLGSEHLNIVDPLFCRCGEGQVCEICRNSDKGAILLGETALGDSFVRIYSPSSLKRIILPGLSYTLYRIRGIVKVEPDPRSPAYRIRHALLAQKT